MENDETLLRNAGTTRDRRPDDRVEELELEVAIARNVRQLRHNSGLSVGDMAARIGISKAMLSKVENAQTSCSLSTLALLSKGFDVPVTYLFRGADTERPASFVKAGKGTPIVRSGSQAGHEYHLLGGLRGEQVQTQGDILAFQALRDAEGGGLGQRDPLRELLQGEAALLRGEALEDEVVNTRDESGSARRASSRPVSSPAATSIAASSLAALLDHPSSMPLPLTRSSNSRASAWRPKKMSHSAR